jgi:hypothetical protein
LFQRLAFGQTDLFKHFTELAQKEKIPPIEELEQVARKLYRAYSSSRAQYRALYDTDGTSEWSRIIPMGSSWTGVSEDESSCDIGSTAKPSKSSKGKGRNVPATSTKKPPAKKASSENTSEAELASDDEEPFQGDRVLSNSIGFMRDAMLSREVAEAVADGDVGRVYEALKVNLKSECCRAHVNN